MASNDLDESNERASTKNEDSSQEAFLLKARQALYETINTAPCSQNPFFMKQEQNSSYKRGVVYLLRHIDQNIITCQRELLEAMDKKAIELKSEVFDTIVQTVNRLIESHLVQDAVASSDASNQENTSPKP